MKIKVTEKHIEKGRAKKSDACPVALALLEVAPLETSVGVIGPYVNVYYPWRIGSAGERVDLSEEVNKRIQRFDLTGYMGAFEFDFPTK